MQWEKNSDDYHAGKMSFDELIRQSDRLIECSEKRREKYLKENETPGEMVINKPKP